MKNELDGSEDKKSLKQLIKENPNLDKFMSNLRRTRFRRKTVDLLARLFIISRLFTTADGRRYLGDPYLRKAFFQRKYRLGLLEDSIIANHLYFPNEGNTSLENLQARAGRWYACDFYKRNMGIKDSPKNGWQDGRLVTILPDELKNTPPDQYTPTFYIDILNFSDLMFLDTPKIEDAIGDGLLQETNYEDAYQKIGLYEKYRQFIILAGIGKNIVYQVTPKGNGLVRIMSDSGEKVQKPKTHPAFEPAFRPF